MNASSSPDAKTPVEKKGRGRIRFGLVMAGALVGGAIGGTGGFAIASGGAWGGGHHGPRLEKIQSMVNFALDSVGATSAQEAKIHDIIASTYTSMMQGRPDREAMRTQVLGLLRAPAIDRAAIEKLRTDQVAAFETRSKVMVGAVLDAVDQLSPEQRTALADRAQAMMDMHRMGERFWGRHGRDDTGGPDAAPSDGPTKD